MTDILTRTIELVTAYLRVWAGEPPEVTADSSLEGDLACDQIDRVCLEIEMEDAFDVRFPADPLENCETVGDLAALVERMSKREAA